VTEAGVPVIRSTRFRMYVEESGIPDTAGSIQTGLAIAAISGNGTAVDLELLQLDGTSTGLTTSVTVAAGGQAAVMLKDLFPSLQRPFKGILRFTSPNTMGALALRIRNNERGEFLISTLSPSDELAAPSSAERLFPHIGDGLGLTSQLILLSGTAGQAPSGSIVLRTNGGQPLDLGLQ
jgi:hypothetical protein